MNRPTSLTNDAPTIDSPARALLIVHRISVQNANAISSPMTWGFPAITAFTGFMTSLERRLGSDAGIAFFGVGVICHSFEPQVAQSGYVRRFKLTRNPVLADGQTAAIIEEGRVHIEITLVFDVELVSSKTSADQRADLLTKVDTLISAMRLAGGSVMPPPLGSSTRLGRSELVLVPDDDEKRINQFNRLKRTWLPGFALVSRHDLLEKRLYELTDNDPGKTILDAWLSLVSLTRSPIKRLENNIEDEKAAGLVDWQYENRHGWLVPIPVGYSALTELHPPPASQ